MFVHYKQNTNIIYKQDVSKSDTCDYTIAINRDSVPPGTGNPEHR
mgnify:CR=1